MCDGEGVVAQRHGLEDASKATIEAMSTTLKAIATKATATP
jgi:hypothetical protein